MAVRRPLVLIGGQVQELPAADSLPGGGGASACAFPLDGWALLARPGRWSGESAFQVSGSAIVEIVSGALNVVAPGSASLRSSLVRVAATSGASANAFVDALIQPNRMWRGNVAGRGGFVYSTRFSVTSTLATQHGFFGIFNCVSAIGSGGTDGTNGLGLAFNKVVDSNYQIVCHGTKIDLGSNFPLGDPSAVLDVTFRCPTNGAAITYEVEDLNSGATASGTISSGLFPNTLFLAPRAYVGNGATAAVASCDVIMIYASSYWSA